MGLGSGSGSGRVPGSESERVSDRVRGSEWE